MFSTKSLVTHDTKLFSETLVTVTQKATNSLLNILFKYSSTDPGFIYRVILFCFAFIKILPAFSVALSYTGITGKAAEQQRFWLSF